MEEVDGVGFLTADKIASGLGIREDSRFRISAAVIHTLKEAINKNGHTYLPRAMLVKECLKLLRLQRLDADALVESVLDDMEVSGKIVCLAREDHTAVLLSGFYISERAIAGTIVRLARMQPKAEISSADDIAEYERINGIVLHDNQKKAVQGCLNHGICVVTGGPGTGKTTIIKCIISILKQRGLKVALCAPTGRAAKRLTEATGEEAKTIHRMLDLSFGDGGIFSFGESSKLDADAVIVDEVSMCDEYVFSALLSALKGGASLVMVGDKDQLPSVGAGNVLADVIASGVVPVYYLTQIYRQSEDSKIDVNAHRINRGEMPDLDNRSSDFFFEEKEDSEDIARTAADLVTRRLPKYLNVPPMEIQVLCPMKRGRAGTIDLNAILQSKLNPPSREKKEARQGDTLFREGDKVMQTQNNYQQEWVQVSGSRVEAGTGVFNGDIGIIESINPQTMQFTVRFDDDKVAVYQYSDIEQLAPAYAVTIHKSQGCEFDAVVVALDANYMLQTRNLLYTAVTRAKKLVVIVGAKKTVAKMVRNNETARRNSLLLNLIEEECRGEVF